MKSARTANRVVAQLVKVRPVDTQGSSHGREDLARKCEHLSRLRVEILSSLLFVAMHHTRT